MNLNVRITKRLVMAAWSISSCTILQWGVCYFVNRFFRGSFSIFGGSACVMSSVCSSSCSAEKTPKIFKDIVVDFLQRTLRNKDFDRSKELIFLSVIESVKKDTADFDECVACFYFIQHFLNIKKAEEAVGLKSFLYNPLYLRSFVSYFWSKNLSISEDYENTLKSFLKEIKNSEKDFKTKKFEDISEGLNGTIKEAFASDFLNLKTMDVFFENVRCTKDSMWRLLARTLKQMGSLAKEVYSVSGISDSSIWSNQKKDYFSNLCCQVYPVSLNDLNDKLGFSKKGVPFSPHSLLDLFLYDPRIKELCNLVDELKKYIKGSIEACGEAFVKKFLAGQGKKYSIEAHKVVKDQLEKESLKEVLELAKAYAREMDDVKVLNINNRLAPPLKSEINFDDDKINVISNSRIVSGGSAVVGSNRITEGDKDYHKEEKGESRKERERLDNYKNQMNFAKPPEDFAFSLFDDNG